MAEWFDEAVLNGRTDLNYKLEFLSVVDLNRALDRDASIDTEGGDFPSNTISELFETDTVVPTEDLLNILARDERISIEDEIRENMALLAVSSATEAQMDAIISKQSEIQSELGPLHQVANTRVSDIGAVFSKYEIPDSVGLAEDVKQEANQLQDILEGH